jgi:2-amino-4-hydroxy-6-hydroxymethyldihydropteridine diphosphokinase
LPGLSSVRAYLGLGGNIGDPRATMAAALRLLDADPEISVERVSSLYRTPPWGITDQPDFLNAAAAISTTLEPRDLLARCLAAEQALHRLRDRRWGPRSVDLDVLVYDDLELDEPGLELPHPRMMDRAFVLVPLLEIAPDLAIGGIRIDERLAELGREGIERTEGPEWRDG